MIVQYMNRLKQTYSTLQEIKPELSDESKEKVESELERITKDIELTGFVIGIFQNFEEIFEYELDSSIKEKIMAYKSSIAGHAPSS